ncbi:uncharacterized protein N7484_007550 [Penicillium longicatenatum]|uniref:uncharacterized protein n=1 Tax=Penicillium longicatenatum TaxID=1561947 RepID=UPI0025495ADC|nr:uncharacterized protein N7484_007550 [Penicillium longicatenatum]KAJ5639688.1 hypothetical protein N7484_007550 [Penicillium longicatenatum]
MYKTNYDIYKCESIDSRRSPPPDELLSPLATLYPHVAAMQPQYNPNNCTFTGYRQTDYWAAAYTTQPLDESAMLTRRSSEQPCRRFVSKLRRFLNRDDVKHRRRSEATTRTTLS